MSAPATTPAARDRRLTPDDLEGYLRLREGTFGYPGRTDEVLTAFRQRLARSWGTFVGDELVSVVTRHAYTVWVAGRTAAAGGFGAVQTAPEHRRTGHVARLMRASLEDGRAEGQGWNLLYPFDAAFYGRYGWVSVPTTVPLELPPEALPAGVRGGLRRVDAPAGEGLRAAYDRFAATRTFADTRRAGPWDPFESLDGAPGQRVLRFASDDAFLAIRLHDLEHGDVRLEVLDLGWVDATGRDAVWGAITGFRGQATVVTIGVPWDDPVVLDRSRRWAARGPAGLMVRLVDVGLALAPLRAVSDDDAPLDLPPVVVRVVDDDLPWNDATWRLTPTSEGVEVRPHAGGADATVDVRALTLLLSGAAPVADVRRVGWAEGDGRTLAVLAALSGGRRPFRSNVDRF